MKLAKNIKRIAQEVLLNESRAIEKITAFIDDNFEACVQEIYSAKGRVVITGIGKSAIIANKIVATLNSTGTPSIFMHAADAIHGDLGMIQREDIVICISKSGNTPEIKVLVPLSGNRLILAAPSSVAYFKFHHKTAPTKVSPTTNAKNIRVFNLTIPPCHQIISSW